jgi:hypothetical protein
MWSCRWHLRGSRARTSREAGRCGLQPARYLFEQVVAGMGVRQLEWAFHVAAEVYLEDAYGGNCLVNAMT